MGGSRLKVFTYSQYIKCIHTFRLNAVMQLAEESREYKLEQQEKKYSHDKLIKNILQNKKEATEFINQFLEPREEIQEKELLRYTNSYITKKYKAKEADLVYKLKNQDIFFLIEHQSSIDNNMPYRILNYCLDIMREWSRNKKIGRNTSYPIIVPIIIYTGEQKWKIPKNFKEKQISNYVFERYKIDLEYNFIDIHKCSKQVLFEKDTMFGYAMFLEKAKNNEELHENLSIIINSTKKKENLEELHNIISYLLNKVLDEETKIKLLKEIDKKVGEKEMSTLVERLRRDLQNQRKQARKEGKKEVAENMLNLKLDEKIILKATGIKKEELEEIKRNIVVAS